MGVSGFIVTFKAHTFIRCFHFINYVQVDPLCAAVMSVSDQGNNQQMLQRAVEVSSSLADICRISVFLYAKSTQLL